MIPLHESINKTGLDVPNTNSFNASEKLAAKGSPLSASARDGIWLLDVWMPQMNGLEVQARIRRDSPETRIIFMTGRDDPSVRQTALDSGAFAFLTKPFEDEALVKVVHKALAA